jgi:uncharacterized FlaG/YvyC family protein
LGRLLAGSSQELKISIDPALRRAVFRIVDSKTGDIILQVPSEEAMRINKMLEQSADGGGTAGPAAGLLMQGKA